MVFSSAVFLFVFLPAVFLLDRLLPGIRAKNALLLIASLIFYAFGQPVYLPLLLLSVLLNYVCGRMAAGKHARLGVALAVIGGIGMLAVFKYADFLIGSLNSAFGLALPLTGIALPIGISFFTFQGLSYVIDVYRDRTVVSRSFVKVLLYIAYFPQLIAGPIVKYHDIEKEIDDRRTTPQETAHGIRRFICGLSKKLLLSNAMGRMADAVFTLPAGEIGMFAAWMGAICYTLQIYFDFSGYSDMAIGMGRMFGFHFQENFNYPYTATTIKEFWRRWHISLSTWFRDYLYVPLGGNRKGRGRTWVNRFLVFFATGLWHGASWNFVLWGLWHGTFSVLEDSGVLPVQRLRGRLAGRIYTLLVVVLGFTLFRADTLAQAGAMFFAMFTGVGLNWAGTAAVCALLTPSFLLCLLVSLLLSAPVAKRLEPKREWITLAGSLVLLVLCMLDLSAGTFNPFIYFRF
ncbi:MBOAT family O-acyltransferase [Agathobaculum desmolans]|uniref:MBOAT family O-acyltransferase n=1 Tax=Agathobaculum desmolans TaxID=39484 RepID=UPI00248EFF57|nr:MBOAT family O-acyltransferase [Agathobaculum desmolans]